MTTSKIRIKRTSTTAIVTGTLAVGELGYSSLLGTQNNTGDRLYIGLGASDATTSPILIGGKYFTDMLDHAPGTLTNSSALIVDSSGKLDVINIGNITITGSTGVISSTNTDGNITLTPNGAGYVQISGTNALVLPAGTTAQQAPSINGAIRYNTTTSSFEGYASSNWSSLGGVRSVDGKTYIIAETTPGASDDILHFYASNNTAAVEVAQLNTSSLKLLQTTANAGDAISGALQVAGGAGIAGSLYVGNALTVTGLAGFTDLATFNHGVTISGNATTATEYFRITNGTSETFSVDTANGSTSIASTLEIGGTTTVGGDFGVAAGKFIVAASTGNTSVAGTLGVTGATTLSSTLGVTGATTLSSTLGVTGDLSVNTNKFTVAATSGNTAVGGTLNVTSTADIGGNFSVATNKFTVNATNGNAAVAGDLTVTGSINLNAVTATTGSFSGDLTVGTNKFTVAATSGDTAVGGTLSSAGNFSVATNKFTVNATSGNTAVGGTLTVSGTSSLNGNLSMNGYKITGLADPINSQDAATKNYVDTMSQGLHVHPPVDFVTTTDIATSASVTVTYTAGPATAPYLGDYGPGSYLTFSAAPTFLYYNATTQSTETATFANYGQERVLVIGQTDATQNGIYVWATATTFVRAIDAETSYAVNNMSATLTSATDTITLTTGSTSTLSVGMPVFKVGGTGVLGVNAEIKSIESSTELTLTISHATSGTINLAFGYGDLAGGDFVYVNDSGYGYVQTTEYVIMGTSNVTWSQFAGQGSWLAGAGLSLTGNSFSVNTANGLTVSGGNVQIASSAAGNGLTFSSGVFDIVGTTDRLSVSSNSIDIASTYLGQTSITTVGTIITGVWNGTTIGSGYGGTGFSTYAKGDILYASDTNTLSKLAKGIDGQVLMLDNGVPAWMELDGGTF